MAATMSARGHLWLLTVLTLVHQSLQAPLFINATFTANIRYDVDVGHIVEKVTAKDPNLLGSLEYDVNGLMPAPGFFAVNRDTGVITVAAPLRSDTLTSYTLIVEAYDSARPQTRASTKVAINVDRNPEPPILNTPTLEATILETTEAGSSVLMVSAADPDKTPVHFELVDTRTDQQSSQYFMVDYNSGGVMVRRPLTFDPDRPPTYNFGVRVTDSGVPPRTSESLVNVRINVVRNMYTPAFIGLPYTANITRTAQPGDVILSALAVDADSASSFSTLRYAIYGNIHSDMFAVNNDTGEVSLFGNLNESKQYHYKLLIEVCDLGGLCNITTASIYVITNQFSPVFLPPSSKIILETWTAGRPLLTASAIDRDTTAPDNVVTYSLAGSAEAMSCFAMNPHKGHLTIKRSLLDGQCNETNYVIQLRAMDGGNPQLAAAEETVTITVYRNTYTPQFIHDADSITIRGNVSTGNIVYTVTAVDDDEYAFGNVSYELIGDTETLTYFRVDPATGDVITIGNLTGTRKTTLSARVLASDDGTPPRESATVVNINVINNHYGPAFTRSSYDITVPTSRPRGSVLTTVSAVDPDTVWENGDVEYLLKDSDSSNNVFCGIGRESGEVYLLRDLAGISAFTCQIEARDKAPKPRSDTTLVKVTVLSAQRLTYVRSEINVTISDKQDVGRSFAQVAIEQTATVTYSLIGTGRAPIFFEVNNRTGAISVTTKLTSDPDALTSYLLLVEAKSLDGLSSATASVNVTVVRQDNDPVFLPSSYTVTLPEDTLPGTRLIATTAVDSEGEMILYSISGPGRDLFLMHPLTGDVFLWKALQQTNSTRYQLSLHARSVGAEEPDPMGTLTVIIIRDTSAPFFVGAPYRNTIELSASPNDTVMRVVAQDPNLNGVLKYNIEGLYFKDTFGINTQTGEIIVVGNLSRDTETYKLIVVAYDSRYPENKATTTATVNVNVNPNTPVCQPSSIRKTLPVNAVPGDVIADVNATDADGDELTYTFANSDREIRDHFFLDSTNGKLLLRRSFTTTGTSFTFSVRATDQYGKSCVASLSVNVLSDTPPTFTGIPDDAVNVSENSQPGDSVFMMTAQDRDLKGSLAYEITGQLGASAFFEVGRNTGLIKLKSSLKKSFESRFTILVAVFDTVVPTVVTTGTVQVNVLRNMNGPVWSSSTYSVTITEITPGGSDILNTTAVDNDDDSIRYEFVRGPITELFRIDTDTGTISLRSSLVADTSRRQVYTLPLIARDQRAPEKSATATATVNVRRDSQPPEFINIPSTSKVEASSPVNTTIIFVAMIDRDLQGKKQFEMIGDDVARSFFRVTPDNGQIVIQRDLQLDNSMLYTITIKAYDSAYPANAATSTVTVSVDRNANIPVLSQLSYSARIPENTPPGTPVLTVTGVDADGDTLSYKILRSENATQEYFNIDQKTGVLTVGSDLTSPLVPTTVMVRISDNGVPQKHSVAPVTVTLIRDSSSPRFTDVPYSASLVDTVAVNTTVITVAATDGDLYGSMNYKIKEDSLPSVFFWIAADTGVLYTRRRLTLANLDRFDVEVMSYDSAFPGNIATTEVAVSIISTQANDNTNGPVFSVSDYAVTVYEYVDCGTSVLRVTATDDDGDAIQYRIINRPGDLSLVNIDPANGDIYVLQSLATSEENTYMFTVEASDLRRVPRTSRAVVNVSIERDIPILITNLPSTVTVNESMTVGERVYTVQAIDRNGVGSVRYALVGGIIPVQYFSVTDTGDVVVAASLRDIKTQTFTLQIDAWKTNSSASVPKVQSTLTVNVRINGNAPRFINAPYTVTISSDLQIGEEVIAVDTFDWDRDNVTYSFDGGSDYLYIHPVTGSVILTKSLTHANISQIVATVKAVDRMQFPRLTTTVLTVNVRSNVIYPQFGSTPYNITIPETMAAQSSVFTVYAIDNDLKGQLMYEVTGIYPAPYFFSLSPFGRITLIKPLTTDIFPTSRYDFRIVAFDATAPDTRGTVTVTINVVRNPNGPVTPQTQYRVNVSEVASLDAVLFTMAATDLDGDDLKYRLSGDNTYFNINDTGDIYPTRSLIGLGGESFVYTVTVADSGRPSKTTEVGLTVSVLSGAPVFSDTQYDVTINDDAVAGTLVTTVAAQTPQGRVTYDLSGFGLAPVFFGVDSATGSVTIARNLKHGTDRLYTVRVFAYDVSYPNYYSAANVTIRVARNINSPLFDSPTYKASIEDGMELGSVVTSSVSASDADGDTVTYSIVSNDQCKTLLAMDPASGIIRLRRLPATNITGLSCRIQASDNNYYQAKTATVVLEVTVNQEEYPVFDQMSYKTSLTEQAPVSYVVFTVTAGKTNLAGTMIYELIGVYPAPSFFMVNSTTGDVSIQSDLKTDAAGTAQYELKLVAYDSINPSRRATADGTVTVTRNVYGPVFASSSLQTKVDFDVDINTWCFPINVTDRDSGVITCSFTSQTAEYADFFTIDPRTCVVMLKQSPTVDDAAPDSFSMMIRATDDGRVPKMATMVLTVDVPRDASVPRIVNLPTSVNIQDTAAVGRPVFTVRVSDLDLQGVLRCDIIGDGVDTVFFRIDNLNRIILRNSLAFDTRNSYVVRVGCYDTTWPTHAVDGMLTVSVDRTSTNQSDCATQTSNNTPEIPASQYFARVSRSARPGLVLIRINATDADGDAIRYSVVSSSIGALAYFYLDPVTGEIFTRNLNVAERLDQDEVTYNLMVAATDPYGGQSTTTVYITVQPPQLPVFDDTYVYDVPAALLPGQRVMKVTATKADLKGGLRYKLTGIYPSVNYFTINGFTGEIFLNKTLQSDDIFTNRHKLIVVAYDTGEPSSEATTEAIINVVDTNPSSPTFSQPDYTLAIPQLAPIGGTVYTLTASDQDGNNVTYSQSGNDLTRKYFFVNPMTGDIILSGDLTESAERIFTIVVTVTDDGIPRKSSQASVTISVETQNKRPAFEYPACNKDSSGKCDTPTYSATITSGTTGGLTVYPIPRTSPPAPTDILARNTDGGKSIVFTVKQTDPVGYAVFFNVTSSVVTSTSDLYRAALTQTIPINRRNVRDLTLVLTAKERSSIGMSSTALVYVKIGPSNDNPPIIASSTNSFTGYIREDAEASFFVKDSPLQRAMRLIYSDRDVVLGDPVQEYVSTVDGTDSFSVDGDGYVRLARSLDYDTQNRYVFQVTVSERDTTLRRSATVSLTVSIIKTPPPSTRCDCNKPTSGTWACTASRLARYLPTILLVIFMKYI